MVKVVLILTALIGCVVSEPPVGLDYGQNYAFGGTGGHGGYVGGYGSPGHQTIVVNHPHRLLASPVTHTVLAQPNAIPVHYAQQYVQQAPVVVAQHAPLYAPVHLQHHHVPFHAHYSAAHHTHQVPLTYGPPPPKVFNLGARLNLNLGGNGGHGGYVGAAPVVKTAVVKKPVVSPHNYDLAPFKPIIPGKTKVYEAPSDYSITPSISYGYSYKLVPTHSYGPVHSQVPKVKVAQAPVLVKGHKNGGLGFGLDLGFDIGHDHH
ncbi:unnamed protein product [Allacma fusca]|uniref:Uncharacterized protein n=1 Tax=Allacma fusca TaxID=39272 RepID=A0A8J2LGY2_9HEXA|nr:unnamed protein product [Allacma fusca]